MARTKTPVTAATRELKKAGIVFSPHLYNYQERGGTEVSARELGLDEHQIIKTLIMEDDQQQPLIILMHGNRQVSTKNLARHLGKKSIIPCQPATANRHSGYLVGGTSPFGIRKKLPVYMEKSILDLETVYLNGGKRGFLVGLGPQKARELLRAELVEVAL